MHKKRFVDPFFPNRPVDDPDRFSGREIQVDEVADSLFQIANSNPKHTIITGDRGMGKSSLLLQTRMLATGDNRLVNKLDIDIGYDAFNYIIAWHDANYDQTPEHIVSGLLRDLEGNISKLFGKFNLELDLYGLKVGSSVQKEKTVADLVNDFCDIIKKSYKAVIDGKKQGIILFIDELDRVRPDSGIATFFKLATEKLSREGIKKVGFFCAGITGAIQKLEVDHGSVFRTFRDVPIPRLTKSETSDILSTGFCGVGFTFDRIVLDAVFELSSGFPEPVHILGSEMLSEASSKQITIETFNKAKKRVVTDVKKNKLKSLLEKAGYGKYQKILEAMAKYEGPYVPLDFISRHIGYDQKQFSTNISNLIERETITRVDKGVYAFVDPLLKEYIRNFGIINIKDNVDNDEQ
ncbi:ATP-binding protein [Paenibacillus sabinae]|uniref:PyrBI operon leader peptide n=1 Tax=Paenibacillus sabinae T27 TaxID=1268072 RepID=X4ZRB6_9BACL|nr:ATP-binding protein [Paenibacillus sabinae]AHV99010.1 PyrBI operon leader peptide [Paenibacillus sabinae T27]